MRYFRLILLLSVAISASGYRWRCYVACDDQTAIQNDYVENRDACREESQANLDEAMIKSGVTDTPKARKLKLITLFSDCMGKFGWEVPVPGDKESKIAAEVPIYESTVSKAKAAPPKDGLNPAATEPAVIEGETKQDQKTLERKIPPENVGKQEKQVKSTNETNNKTNNSVVQSQKPAAKEAKTVNSKDERVQPKETRRQPATTRSASQQNIQQQPQQQQQDASPAPAQKTTNNSNAANNSTRTLNQKANASQAPEQDQPAEMRQQPAVTARAAKPPSNTAQPDTQQQIQSETNRSTATTNNRSVVQSRQAAQAQNAQQTAPVTTITPDSADEALTQSIQKRPAETKIKYQNNKSARGTSNNNGTGPSVIPQQPSTSEYQPSAGKPESRVAAVIDPANNNSPVKAVTADSTDQALSESIHKKASKRSYKNSKSASQPGVQTQAQTTNLPQGQTQAQTISQPQQQLPQQAANPKSATAVAPVNNINNTRYNNTATNPATNGSDASKIPSQPAVTKNQQINPRAAECELARRNAANSTLAAQQAKECELECAKIMKVTPKIINPAPCPVKDAAVNVLDVQLRNKK